MKKIIVLLLAVVVGLMACRKDTVDTDISIVNPTPAKYVKASIGGIITNENGAPVPDATVYLEQESVKTDQNGVFLFSNKVVNGNGAYIKVEHPQYFHGSRTITVNPATRNNVRIQLLSNTSTQFVSATAGGLADYTNYSVQLPAGGIVTEASGADYTGQVGVAAKWLDPSQKSICDQMPGRLMGLTTDGQLSGMVTMGMLAVELKDDAGHTLQIKNGFEAAIRMKVASSILNSAPATIPLWYFDENAGIWVEEGEAKLVNGYYEGKVKHFSFWNHDYKDPLVEINFKVVDENGAPIENAVVYTTMPSTGMFGYGSTDNTGHILGLVPQNTVLNLEVFLANSNCPDAELVQQIGPFTQNGDICLTVLSQAVLPYTISGNLVNCSGAPVTSGYVQITGQNEVIWVDENGHFEKTILTCVLPQTLTVKGHDFAATKVSPPVTVDVSGGIADFGTITVCETLDQYFIYQAGNLNYQSESLAINAIDSVPGGVIDVMYLKTDGPFFASFVVEDVTGVGTYSLNYFTSDGVINGQVVAHGCNSPANCAGMTVNITEYNGIGGYIGGTFNGTLNDLSGQQQPPPTIQVTGSFRAILTQ